MPAHLMDDQRHAQLNSGANLFADYATVADSLGVYTTSDYAAIVDHLVERWGVADLQVGRGGMCCACRCRASTVGQVTVA
jgi:acyl-[acyl-carrier-protein] desaturase